MFLFLAEMSNIFDSVQDIGWRFNGRLSVDKKISINETLGSEKQ